MILRHKKNPLRKKVDKKEDKKVVKKSLLNEKQGAKTFEFLNFCFGISEGPRNEGSDSEFVLGGARLLRKPRQKQ